MRGAVAIGGYGVGSPRRVLGGESAATGDAWGIKRQTWSGAGRREAAVRQHVTEDWPDKRSLPGRANLSSRRGPPPMGPRKEQLVSAIAPRALAEAGAIYSRPRAWKAEGPGSRPGLIGQGPA